MDYTIKTLKNEGPWKNRLLIATPSAGNVRMEWVTARDEKVRQAHNQMDGQVANAQGLFAYGMKQFEGPGMLGEPGFDINCRCGVAPIITGIPLLAGLGV